MEERYPFAEFLIEDKTRYPLASEKGYYDPYNHFRIGDSGGFIMNIRPGKFINTHFFTEMADYKGHNIPFQKQEDNEFYLQ